MKGVSGAASGFIGFGSFASPSPPTSSASLPPPSSPSFGDGRSSSSSSYAAGAEQGGAAAALAKSPYYAGGDKEIAMLFKSLAKKDKVTKTKVLAALRVVAFQDGPVQTPDSSSPSPSSPSPPLPSSPSSLPPSAPISKHESRHALCHYVHLFGKLYLSNDSSVRLASVLVLSSAQRSLPKAFDSLLLSHSDVSGPLFALASDPIKDVSLAAQAVIKAVLKGGSTSREDDNDEVLQALAGKALRHVVEANKLSKADVKERLQSGEGGSGGGKGGSSPAPPPATEGESEDVELCHDRLVTSCLGAAQRIFGLLARGGGAGGEGGGGQGGGAACRRVAEGVEVQDLLCRFRDGKKTFRRETYRALTAYVSCVAPARGATAGAEKDGKSDKCAVLSSKIVPLLSSERDPLNHPSMWEFVVTFVKCFGLGALDAGAFLDAVDKHLASAFHGSADDSAPFVLPLLSLLPPDLAKDGGATRYPRLELLASLQTGLSTLRPLLLSPSSPSSIQNSPQSYFAMSLSLAECASFVLTRAATPSLPSAGASATEAFVRALDSALSEGCRSGSAADRRPRDGKPGGREGELREAVWDCLCRIDASETNEPNKETLAKVAREHFWCCVSSAFLRAAKDDDRKPLCEFLSVVAASDRRLDPASPLLQSFAGAFRVLASSSSSSLSSSHATALDALSLLVQALNVGGFLPDEASSMAFWREYLKKCLVESDGELFKKKDFKKCVGIFLADCQAKDASGSSQILSELWEDLALQLPLWISLDVFLANQSLRSLRFDTLASRLVSISTPISNARDRSLISSFISGTRALSPAIVSSLSTRARAGGDDCFLTAVLERYRKIMVTSGSDAADELASFGCLHDLLLQSWTNNISKSQTTSWRSVGRELFNVAAQPSHAHFDRSLFLDAVAKDLKASVSASSSSSSSNDWAERLFDAILLDEQQSWRVFEQSALGDLSAWKSGASSAALTSAFDAFLKLLIASQARGDAAAEVVSRRVISSFTPDLLWEVVRSLSCEVEGGPAGRRRPFEEELDYIVNQDRPESENVTALLLLMEDRVVSGCIELGVNVLIGKMADSDAHLTDKQCVQAISAIKSLMRRRFGREHFTNAALLEFELRPTDVVEEGQYWYRDDNLRVDSNAVVVKKIHRDDGSNLYFTIRDVSSGDEKQTVLSRLSNQQNKALDDDDFAAVEKAKEWLATVVKGLGKLSNRQQYFLAMSVCSLLLDAYQGAVVKSGPKGIGSLHFDLFSAVKKIAARDQATRLSMSDSLACVTILGGRFGANWSYLATDVSSFVNSCVAQVAEEDGDARVVSMFLERASLWLCEWKDLSLCASLINDVMEVVCEGARNANVFVVVGHALGGVKNLRRRAVHLRKEKAGGAAELGILVPAVRHAVDLFADYDKQGNATYDSGFFKSFGDFVLDRSLHVDDETTLFEGVRIAYDKVVRKLFDEETDAQIISYRLLRLAARRGAPVVKEITTANLKLIEANVKLAYPHHEIEERETIEDDIEDSCKVIPEALRCVLETQEGGVASVGAQRAADWRAACFGLEGRKEGVVPRSDGAVLVGKVLSFLALLDFVDGAVGAKSCERNAMGTYINGINIMLPMMNFFAGFLDVEAKAEEWLDLLDRWELGGVMFEGGEEEEEDEGEENLSASDKLIRPLSCFAFFRCVQCVPAMAKEWCNSDCKEKVLRDTAVSFVEKRVSTIVFLGDLDKLLRERSVFGEMDVRGSAVSREVVATYVQDTCSLSVTIRIPAAFPFRNVEVDWSRSVGVKESKWHRWGLMMSGLLASQDGGLAEALLLWKNNLDKEFEGVEPCPVCYAVLDPKSHQMPNLACAGCKYKFHSNCLNKWFQNSGKNNCVMCQQPWQGIRL